MNNAIVQTLTFAKLAMRPAVIMTISLAMFLFAACDANKPLSQRDSNTVTGPQGLNGSLSKVGSVSTAAAVPLGSASTFAVLGGTTVTNAGPSLITGNVGVSPGTSITGFPPGTVNGTIYAGGTVAAQAHFDANTAYNYLVLQAPNTTYSGVTELSQTLGDVTSFNKGVPLTPGVYKFDPSANLKEGGTLYLDFQGNSDALFIFQMGTTLVTKLDSKVIAINNPSQTCSGSNVYWAVGSSATIDGAQFLGTVIATTTITMTSAANTPVSTIVSGRMLALNGAVTMSTDIISVCSGGGVFPPPKPPEPCRDFVTGGGWIGGNSDAKGHKNDKATFGVSGGIKNGKFWGQLSFNDHNGVKVKSTNVTAYIVKGLVTRQIEGFAKVNGKGSFAYTVVVADNGERGRNDSFSLQLSNANGYSYSASGTLKGGNIQLHTKCGDSHDKDDGEIYDDQDERDGHDSCDNDRDWK